jgi:hypothetical protein
VWAFFDCSYGDHCIIERPMIQFSLRLAARFAILVPGIVIAYFCVRNIFPYFDRRLPLGVALVVTYALGAYIIAPAFMRLVRVIRPAEHLPIYCVTPDGLASDPINIGIIGTRRELIQTMEDAGWYMADRHSLPNIFRMIVAILLGRPYPSAPVSSLFLFGRKQDIAFEIPIGSSPSTRHHVRFWATTYDEHKKRLNIKSIHWHHRREHVLDDNLLWVGSASLDVGVNFIRHNLQLSHMIDPDTNREREMIVKQLKTKKLVEKVTYIKLDNPYRLINRVLSGSLHTDGKMAIVKLKN